MGRWGWFVSAAAALIGFYLGKGLGPAPVVFPTADTARSAQELELEVGEALREPRAFPRAVRLVRLFEGLTTENVEGAARAVTARGAEYDPVDLQIFLTAWIHLDPAAAMSEVQSWPIRSRRELGIRIVMREWAASGRQVEATSYYESLTDLDQRAVAAGPLVRGWALAGDAQGALALARRLWENEKQQDVVDGLVRGVLHNQGAEGAIALARSVDLRTGGDFDQRVAQVTLSLVGREDAIAACSYYDEVVRAGPVTGLEGTLGRLAGLRRNDDPRGALEWLLPKAEGAERTRALTETIGVWAIRDFDAAWAWFEAHNEIPAAAGVEVSPTDSALLAGLVRRMARSRPERAADWVMRLRPESDRLGMIRRVAYFWSMVDTAAADRWIGGLPLSKSERIEVREAAEWGRTGAGSPTDRTEAP